MATKAQVAKSNRKPKYSTRIVRRCQLSGRARGVYRKFRISRIMLRKLALEGKMVRSTELLSERTNTRAGSHSAGEA
jgi:small subunit ribosomal protein S14